MNDLIISKILDRTIHNIIVKCTKPSSPTFRQYGGRGIKVHQEWVDNPGLMHDYFMSKGWAPGLHTFLIRRNDGYIPGNIEFITSHIHRRPMDVSMFWKKRWDEAEARTAAMKDQIAAERSRRWDEKRELTRERKRLMKEYRRQKRREIRQAIELGKKVEKSLMAEARVTKRMMERERRRAEEMKRRGVAAEKRAKRRQKKIDAMLALIFGKKG